MNTQNDLILISMHTLKAFTSVLRVFFMWLSFRSAGSDGAVVFFRSPDGQAEVCSVIP